MAVFFAGSLAFQDVKAQQTLDLEDAIRFGLERNYAIQIAENEAQISENNYTIGNAGFLPVVSANGGLNQRVEDNITRFGATIPDRDDEGAKTTIYNYGIDASWKIFDGLTMFATLDRLSVLSEISEIEARNRIELTLADLITAYYQIAGQQKAAQVIDNTVEISKERIRIAKTARELGSGSEYDLLLARADLNTDQAALIRSKTNLNQLKVALSTLLGDTAGTNFRVNPEIELGDQLSLEKLLAESISENRELTIARLTEQAAEAEIREQRGDWYPQVDVSGGYGYSRTEASTGFSEFSETKGFRYGISANVNLFDGFNKQRRQENARIALKNEQLRRQDLELQIRANVSQIYAQYEDALSLMALEEENLEINKKTVDIALERFKLGTINSIELREAQQSLLNAENRLIGAQIAAKSAEIELLRLSGRLLSRVE
ncbi:MAG: TolC family protein [Gracilimonas sp.]|nr:TolC family protein [Gracilimonas sp.]